MSAINLSGGVSLEPTGQHVQVYIVRGHGTGQSDTGTYGDPVRWAGALEMTGDHARVSGLNLMDTSSGRFTVVNAAALHGWLRKQGVKKITYERLVDGQMQTHEVEI
ncbi:hypothetical protein [Nitrosomonas eutropha]|uniref:Uncharacterized protein n=2 Tax=Nitrosomonas eutropha TaxID=916 RepID=A0ABX5M9S9_9PROT|nr:hypothetical protein [Nitrosomonas eutropha]ABI59698.1 hypothetical protein Neut_1452 [Nitrosomonas eutropha C91]PXV82503.1 hypothetical protein C8R14_10775 [Nitrosomonas eutropha]